MPSIIRKNVAAGTSNDLDGLKFQKIPPGGAVVTLYATAAAAGANLRYSVGSEDFLVDCEPNIEASADVVDTDWDVVLFEEVVPEGDQFVEITGQICNYILVIEVP